MSSPKHIVIVPDGNRRWAKKRRQPLFLGYRQGSKTAGKILKALLDLKIPYFTFWGCSVDNLTRRSAPEVKILLDMHERNFKKLAKSKEIHKHRVRVNVLGRWKELLPPRVKKPITEAMEKTKNYQDYQSTILMAYSGVDEMTRAIQRVAKIKQQNPKIKIGEKLIKANLWTKNLPPVDLVIRTGGEPHWSSGMLMWDVANTQLYFTKTPWPDFSATELKKAVNRFNQTERRMGA